LTVEIGITTELVRSTCLPSDLYLFGILAMPISLFNMSASHIFLYSYERHDASLVIVLRSRLHNLSLHN